MTEPIKSRKAKKKATGEEVTLYLHPDRQWREAPPVASAPEQAPMPSAADAPSVVETAKDYAGQGFTLSGFDELAAHGAGMAESQYPEVRRATGRGLDAPLMTQSQAARATYDDAHAAQADNLERGAQANPGTAMAASAGAGMLGGALLAPLLSGLAVPAGLSKLIAPLWGINRATAAAVPAGAGMGAVSGALSAAPGQRAEGAKQGARMGVATAPIAGAVSGLPSTLKTGGERMWKSFTRGGDPHEAAQFAAANAAGAKPAFFGTGGIEPSPQMAAERAAVPAGKMGSDKAFSDTADLVTNAVAQKIKSAPTLDDAASRRLVELQTEMADALKFAERVNAEALAKYPNMSLSTEPLRNTANAIMVRNVADVTDAAREAAATEAASVLGAGSTTNLLLPKEVHTPMGNASALQKFAKELTRRIGSEDELRDLMKPGVGSAAEQADAARVLKDMADSRFQAKRDAPGVGGLYGRGDAGSGTQSPQLWRQARFSVAELVEMRRHVDAAAKAASSMKLDAEARAWNEINGTLRQMLAKNAPDVAKAADEAHGALNVIEAKLEQAGLQRTTREFEPIPGSQTVAIRNRLDQPGMESEVARLFGPDKYAAFTDAERLLGGIGLQRGTRDIEPSRYVSLKNTVTAKLKENPLELSELLARLDPKVAKAQVHAAGSRAVESLQRGAEPLERTSSAQRLLTLSRPLVRTSAALQSVPTPPLPAVLGGLQSLLPPPQQQQK
jgi:hypothetical protein